MGSSILASLSEAGGERRQITNERAPSFPGTDDSDRLKRDPLMLLQALNHLFTSGGFRYPP